MGSLSQQSQLAVCGLPFIVSGLLFWIKVQSQKYKIRICNELSLRVILEHPSARELYREVLWSWQWQWAVFLFAACGLFFLICYSALKYKVRNTKYQYTTVCYFEGIPKAIVREASLDEIMNKTWIKKKLLFIFLFFCLDAKEPKDQGLFLDPWKLRSRLCLRIANRCARLSSTAHRCGARLFYYRSKKYAGADVKIDFRF